MEEIARECDEKKTLIVNELTKGRDLVKQLMNDHLDLSTSRETSDVLVEKIVSSYDTALSLLRWGFESSPAMPNSIAAGTPKGEGTHSDCNDHEAHYERGFKKRKALQQLTAQERVRLRTSMEALDDGYSWRKYGQKDILAANFPRAYYRCSHRNSQGCLATKQVQRSDQEPSTFEVTYRGRHTCVQTSHLIPALASSGREDTNLSSRNNYDQLSPLEKLKQSQKELNFCTGLQVENEGLSPGDDEETSASLSFLSTSFESENLDSHIFGEPMKESDFAVGYSTSDCDNIFLSPLQMNNFEMDQNLQTSESNLTEIVSAPTSVTNSPTWDLDFLLDHVDFDHTFPYDALEFST